MWYFLSDIIITSVDVPSVPGVDKPATKEVASKSSERHRRCNNELHKLLQVSGTLHNVVAQTAIQNDTTVCYCWMCVYVYLYVCVYFC